jgi:TonB-linked outer membrane protein, SusC/RagA family
MKIKFKNISYLLCAVSLFSTVDARAQMEKDSLVNVAFGTVAKKDLLGSVSTVNISDLTKKSYLSGINVLEGLEGLIGGYTGEIWGQAPLILVDGAPRNAGSSGNMIADVRLSEIESISVLKGASAVVLYGSKAAKGVVLITTKRGQVQPLKIDVRANTGLYVPKALPQYLNAAEYMNLYNEAARNDGGVNRYSQSDIYNTAAGTNPFRYPDVNFYSSDYIRKAYNRTDATAEIHGGDERARYYSNFGMVYNNSLMKFGEAKNDNEWRFNVRANLDMNLTEWLTASTNAAVVMYDQYIGRSNNFWSSSATFRPNQFSPLLPVGMFDPYNQTLQTTIENSNNVINGHMLGGTSADQTNTFSDMLAAGYIKYKNRTFLFDVNVGADLSMLLDGLTFKTKYSVDYRSFYSEAYRVGYAVYQPTWSTMNGKDVITGLTQYGADGNATNEYIGDSAYAQTMSFSAQFNYNRTFAGMHNVSAALLGWGYQTQYSEDEDHNGSLYHRISNANLGVQAGYNYLNKYYVDLAGAMVYSAKLPPGNRGAFSPAVTLGWRVSDEAFFKDNVSFVNNLKLTASYANLNQDIDIEDYYMYKGYYSYDSDTGWYQWRDNSAGGQTGASRRGDNPNLSFIQRKEFRVGLEGTLLNNMVTFDANYFSQETNGMLSQGANTIFPSYFNNSDLSYLPYINFNNDKRAGLDFTINVNKKIGQVDATLGFVGMYYTSEATRRDEVYDYDYQYRVGNPLNSAWGYISEGIFMNQAEIDAHARQTFGSVTAGDIKYKDVNGDGVIDNKDEVNLGKYTAPFHYGLNLTLKWRNLTFFALGTGYSGGVSFTNSAYHWVRGNNKYSEVVLDRTLIGQDANGNWEVTQLGSYPRLTATSNANNFRNSTYWMRKTDRFDLRRVQVTYDFPKDIFQNALISNLSVYLSGENLLTLSKERKLMETNIGSAPQTRFFNIGFKTSF